MYMLLKEMRLCYVGFYQKRVNFLFCSVYIYNEDVEMKHC